MEADISLFFSHSRSQSLRGLFERDKIVFSFMLCAQIMRGERKISDVEWNFFLRGSSSMDREYPNKPDAPWLSDRLLSIEVWIFMRPCLRPIRSDGFFFYTEKDSLLNLFIRHWRTACDMMATFGRGFKNFRKEYYSIPIWITLGNTQVPESFVSTFLERSWDGYLKTFIPWKWFADWIVYRTLPLAWSRPVTVVV